MVVVHSSCQTSSSPAFQRTVARVAAGLSADSRVSSVALPRRGETISRDGHTAIVMAGAGADANEMRIAVLLDALLVRLPLVPVLLRLTGRAAWWLPRWLRRALRSRTGARDHDDRPVGVLKQRERHAAERRRDAALAVPVAVAV